MNALQEENGNVVDDISNGANGNANVHVPAAKPRKSW